MYVLIVSRNGVQTFLILNLSGGSECLGERCSLLKLSSPERANLVYHGGNSS